jgi:hypothetical protein
MTFSEQDKRALTAQVRGLRGPARSFVSEIFRQARKARGRLDDDVYGILQATLEALQQTGGAPPPLIFGVSHYETGEVEQVGFLPPGVTRVPPGGRFVTNHPGIRPADVRPPIPPRRGGAHQIED